MDFVGVTVLASGAAPFWIQSLSWRTSSTSLEDFVCVTVLAGGLRLPHFVFVPDAYFVADFPFCMHNGSIFLEAFTIINQDALAHCIDFPDGV